MKKPEVVAGQDRIVCYKPRAKSEDKRLSRRALRRAVNRDPEFSGKLPKRGWVA